MMYATRFVFHVSIRDNIVSTKHNHNHSTYNACTCWISWRHASTLWRHLTFCQQIYGLKQTRTWYLFKLKRIYTTRCKQRDTDGRVAAYTLSKKWTFKNWMTTRLRSCDMNANRSSINTYIYIFQHNLCKMQVFNLVFYSQILP